MKNIFYFKGCNVVAPLSPKLDTTRGSHGYQESTQILTISLSMITDYFLRPLERLCQYLNLFVFEYSNDLFLIWTWEIGIIKYNNDYYTNLRKKKQTLWSAVPISPTFDYCLYIYLQINSIKRLYVFCSYCVFYISRCVSHFQII